MIIFDSVTKQFGDESIALQDVSFHISEGELVVVTGHSGSGKTTLMRLLTKEYDPTSGEIVFNEVPLSSIKPSQIHHHRRQLGIVFQDYKLLSELNVWENIALALNIISKSDEEVEMRVTDLLRLVDLVDKAFLFPSQLSGGEAQRVSIARALATAPKVIFADEPTGNLDPETSVSIAKLLEKIHGLGTTVIIATHDLSVMNVLTKERHLQLEKGKIVKDTGFTQPKKTKKTEPPKHETAAKAEQEPELKHNAESPPEPEEKKKKKGFKLGLPKITVPFGKKPKQTEEKSEAPPEKESSESEKITVKVETLD